MPILWQRGTRTVRNTAKRHRILRSAITPDCGLLVGVFTTTRPTGGFVGKFAADLDENVDILPSKICPDCGMEMDIDYPRCPTCGYVFETK